MSCELSVSKSKYSRTKSGSQAYLPSGVGCEVDGKVVLGEEVGPAVGSEVGIGVVKEVGNAVGFRVGNEVVGTSLGCPLATVGLTVVGLSVVG